MEGSYIILTILIVFIFAGQELRVHADRDSCEISVSVHISTNLEEFWPLWIKTPDTYNEDMSKVLREGDIHSVCLSPGDGMIYKGCERPHCREPLISNIMERVFLNNFQTLVIHITIKYFFIMYLLMENVLILQMTNQFSLNFCTWAKKHLKIR